MDASRMHQVWMKDASTMHERRSKHTSKHAFTQHQGCIKGSEKDEVMMLDQFINTIHAQLLPAKLKKRLQAWLKDHLEAST